LHFLLDGIFQLGILRNSDPALRAVVDRLEVPLQPSTGNVFEDALSCILDMRIHYTPTNAAFRYKRLMAFSRS
jgi:hypothetical protein